jgi:hypothetical protein
MDTPTYDGQRWPTFGDRPNQVLHPDTADTMLRLLHDRHPLIFGRLVAEAMTGHSHQRARS